MFFYLFLRCNTYKEYEFVLFIAKIWVNLKRHTLKVCSSKFLKQYIAEDKGRNKRKRDRDEKRFFDFS